MLSGCKSDKGSTVQAPVLTADLSAATTDIGKPLDELLSLHTSYEYLHLAGYDFSDECFGAADGSFAFVFFGTQGGPSLKEMAADYAKQLKCAGIHTTVGKIFSGIGDAPVSAKNLLSSVGINNVGGDFMERMDIIRVQRLFYGYQYKYARQRFRRSAGNFQNYN